MTQDNQPLMQQLADMSPGLLYLFDVVEQRTLYINARSLELLGYAPETILAMGANFMADVMHLDDLARMSAHFDRLNGAIDGTFVDIEYRMRHVDGEWRWFNSRDRVFSRTADGQIRQVLGIAQDISAAKRDEVDRKQAEEALRESEELKQRILESSNDCIKVLTLDGHLLYINPGGLCLFEIDDPTSILNTEWVSFWQGENQEKARAASVAARAGNVGQFQGYCPTAKGTPKWWDVIVTPIRDVSDQVAQLLVISRDITQQKQAEAQLRESEERFRSMADNAPVMVWATDSTGSCTYLSQSWYDFTGQTEETGLGLGWVEAVHPEDREFASSTFLAANERCEGFRLEYRLRHKDGEYRWAIDAASPRFGVDGQFKGYIGSVIDISDRKQIEETLRQRETELRLVTNAVPALIAFVDSDQRYRFNNRGYEEWFGYPATEIYGQSIRDVLGETAYEGIRPYVEQVLAGQQVTFESQMPYKEGNTRYVSATYVPRFDPQGAVAGFVALINDISDRKQAEAALRQSEERYRYLAETIPQLVWTANPDGILIDINQRWSAFTGLTLTQAQTQGWEAVIYPDDVPTLNQNWVAAQQVGSHYRAEGRMRRADGAYRWHLHEAIPLKNEQGQLVKWFGTATDIEAQKQLEHQRQSLLEREQAAREQAETANRIKDEFLAVLSHELRSPLNPILGWSKLLRSNKLDAAKTTHALETIERNAKLQTQLIEDLLDVSRILQGKLSLTMAPVDLALTIEAAMETVRLAAAAKSIQLQTMLDITVGQVLGDSARLQQVIWNLLTNAVKFTTEGGRVEIRLSRVTGHSSLVEDGQPKTNDPGQMTPTYAQIQVSDTGKGIHPDFLPHVFEYFRQEDGKTTRKFGGLGLGLAIVRHLVELHGGTVQADSLGEEQGATFIVRLPVLKAKGGSQKPEASFSPLLTPLTLPLADVRILLVDDDADSRDLIAFALEQSGAIITSMASATEALTVLMQTNFDLLISDIGMPNMDGYMLIQQIRAMPSEQGGDILAIALTAYAGEHNQQQAIAAGFQKHLSKPIEPEELVQTITDLIEGLREKTVH